MSDILDFQVVMGALELGIIPPGWDVDEALAGMSASEARLCKRKFRKIVRKARKKFGFVDEEELPARMKRRLAKRSCAVTGHALME